jgi:hypothetical protein
MPPVATSEREAFLANPPTAERSAPRLFEPAGGHEVSLEDSILGIWEDLVATARAECPVCGGHLGRDSACGSCGSRLD